MTVCPHNGRASGEGNKLPDSSKYSYIQYTLSHCKDMSKQFRVQYLSYRYSCTGVTIQSSIEAHPPQLRCPWPPKWIQENSVESLVCSSTHADWTWWVCSSQKIFTMHSKCRKSYLMSCSSAMTVSPSALWYVYKWPCCLAFHSTIMLKY